jgi:hypothetical protein
MNSRYASFALACALAGSIAATSVAHADSGAESHDGLLLRVTTGPSGAGGVAGGYRLSGAGASFAVGVGYAFRPGAVVQLEAMKSVLLGPTLEIGDEQFTSDDDVRWGVNYIGVGATHYYGSSNWYSTGTGGMVFMTLRAPMQEGTETELGYGGRLAFGKEWWATDNLGLGLAMEAMYGLVPDDDRNWSTLALNLVLSATYQ